jgi:DNA repair protein SbcC/Rad50
MRPVLLEMDGFASFRQRTRVDFDDVDYFALVGPTGAGKSTVIDAITFALYGSVARWDDTGAVAPALAPTVNRGTVRLVFDVRGARYHVMRELRRGASSKVQQKVARLERLLEPDARGDVDDAIELIAGSISETGQAVEHLLGLDFNQFKKCVALPQGDFAELLHATPGDRDKILTKLLGLDGYLALGRIANARAARLTTQADTLQHQLDQDGTDISEAAHAAAVAKHEALKTVQDQVQVDIVELGRLVEQERAATQTLTELDRTLQALDALAMPEHVPALDQDLADAGAAVDLTKQAVGKAERADEQARKALRSHTSRARLESWQSQHRQHQQLTADAPQRKEKVAQAEAARKETEAARKDAREAVAQAEQVERKALAAAKAEKEALAAARAQLLQLRAVARPADVDELCESLEAAADELGAARTARTEAQADQRQAAQQRDALPSAVAVERAVSAGASLRTARDDASAAVNALTGAHLEARRATAAATEARTGLEEAERAASSTHARHVAAQLRADLTVGDPCPVCEQEVADIPAAADAGDAEAAQTALTQAREQLRTAERDATRSESTLQTAASAVRDTCAALAKAFSPAQQSVTALAPALDSAQGTFGPLDLAETSATLTAVAPGTDPDQVSQAAASFAQTLSGLDDQISRIDDNVRALQQRCAQADDELKEAVAALKAAEPAYAQAEQKVAALSDQTQQARAQLREVRDPLVAFGAPALDDTDLPGAWATLTSWAAAQADSQELVVATVQDRAERAASTHADALTALQQAQAKRDAAETAYEKAVEQYELASAAQVTAAAQLRDLDLALADAPDLAQVKALLEVLAELEDACATAEEALTRDRTALSTAESRLSALTDARQMARAELAAARDPLVALGAPALLDDKRGLVAAWTSLLDWAGSTRDEQLTARQDAEREVEVRTEARQNADLGLRTALLAAGLPEDPRPLELWAPAEVATACANAAAQVDAINAAQERTATMQAQIRTDREHAAVALQLGRLLASNGFPRWLSKNALEVLVVAASATLMELSGGQFELSIADTDAASFTVIDHADADAERPVKTLSGGETFQASLSLALALSTHLGALASNGAAQLEAIFIDEGFGTLDETTLDTVATTLETLATSAGRMVGVITHVPHLAARVPVQFAVSRDPRGSSIQRVTP